ncbi:MAG: DnaJ domain-containing protein, partial [Planctomycetaceae bacterium]
MGYVHMARTYYQLLGIEEDADEETIRKAYRKAVLESHPDLNEGDDVAKRTRDLNAAVATLTDTHRRTKYDATLRRKRDAERPQPAPEQPTSKQAAHEQTGSTDAWSSAFDAGAGASPNTQSQRSTNRRSGAQNAHTFRPKRPRDFKQYRLALTLMAAVVGVIGFIVLIIVASELGDTNPQEPTPEQEIAGAEHGLVRPDEPPPPSPPLPQKPPPPPKPPAFKYPSPMPNEPTTQPETPPPIQISFTEKVAPILVSKCGRCHISNARGGLSMASFRSLMDGGDQGAVVQPGEASESRLVTSIVARDMPRFGISVADSELLTLEDWIAGGAKYDGDDPVSPILDLVDPSMHPTLAPPLAIAPFDAGKASTLQTAWARHLGLDVQYTNPIGMKFVLIPPGEFTMGETGSRNRSPVHLVRIS